MQVQIIKYHAVDKGSLRGFFTMEIAPWGMKILDCKHFISNGREWVNFPSKETNINGVKEYIPLVCFSGKDKSESFQKLVLQGIKNAKSQSNTNRANSVQAHSRTNEEFFTF